LTIPPPSAGWDLPVGLLPGKDRDNEAFLAVVMRDDVPFPTGGAEIREGLMSVGDALTAINRWLVDIPADRRTEDMAVYKIIK